MSITSMFIPFTTPGICLFPSPTTEQTANAPCWIQPLIQDKRQINARQMAGRGGRGWEMGMLRLTEPFILPKLKKKVLLVVCLKKVLKTVFDCFCIFFKWSTWITVMTKFFFTFVLFLCKSFFFNMVLSFAYRLIIRWIKSLAENYCKSH